MFKINELETASFLIKFYFFFADSVMRCSPKNKVNASAENGAARASKG
jgi:hypothetical protein